MGNGWRGIWYQGVLRRAGIRYGVGGGAGGDRGAGGTVWREG